MTMDWTVYMLRCADGTLYTGISNRLEQRLAAHTAGTGAKYTRGRGPFELIYCEQHASRATASQREHAIKGLKREQKLALSETKWDRP